MARVVLVQPRVGTWDDYRSHPSLPLALLSAARCVAREFETVLVDTRVDEDWKATLEKELAQGPLCVGVTSMTGRQIGHALEISRFVKRTSRVPVVWGGIHASLLPRSTLEDPSVDVVVAGEGELTFLELVRALAARRSLTGIPGVWLKDGAAIVGNPAREFASLDELPDLPLSLVDLGRFLPTYEGRPTFYLETSRGCPGRCGFCFNGAYNRNTWRGWSAERVLEDVTRLRTRHGIESLYVVDDNFFVDPRRARAIAQGFVDRGLGLIWEVQGITIDSALAMDDAFLDLLVRAGLRKVHFGVESGSERVLRSVNKRLSIRDVLAVNERWSRRDLVVQYNFMCGFPGETMEDVRESRDLAFRLMEDNPNALISPFCPFTPYPGTAMYQESLDRGFAHERTLEGWQEADYGSDLWASRERKRFVDALFFASMFLDEHRSREMVRSGFVKLLIRLYRPIARFRVRHLFFRFMPELAIAKLLLD